MPGEISAEELGGIMESLGQKPTKGECEDIVNELDTDRSGTIDFDGSVPLSPSLYYSLSSLHTPIPLSAHPLSVISSAYLAP